MVRSAHDARILECRPPPALNSRMILEGPTETGTTATCLGVILGSPPMRFESARGQPSACERRSAKSPRRVGGRRGAGGGSIVGS